MSIQEQAAQLRAITLPFGPIRQAMQELDDVLAQASQLIGAGGARLDAIGGAVEQAKSSLDGSYSMVQEVESQLEQAAAHHGAS